METEVGKTEWGKLPLIGDPEPQTLVTCRINQEGDNALDVEVTISAPKGTCDIGSMTYRAERAARSVFEAVAPDG